MTWLKRTRRAATAATGCDCTPPMTHAYRTAPFHTAPRPRPDGLYGELWQCDDCRTVWKVGVVASGDPWPTLRLEIGWIRAGWWTQWRYRHGSPVADEHIGDGLRATIADAERGGR